MRRARAFVSVCAALFGAATLFVQPRAADCSDSIDILGNTQGVAWSRGKAADYAAWLAGANDVIFLGRFESWTRDSTGGVSSTRHWTLMRNCGDFFVLGEDGTLLSDHISSEQDAEFRADPRPLRIQDLPVKILRHGEIRTLLSNARGLAVHRLPEGGGVWECINPGWIVPSMDSLPRFVRFPSVESCYSDIAVDASLLPVPAGFAGDTLFVDCCARVLRVRYGEAAAFGVPLDSLPRVVVQSSSGRLEVVEPEWARRDHGR